MTQLVAGQEGVLIYKQLMSRNNESVLWNGMNAWWYFSDMYMIPQWDWMKQSNVIGSIVKIMIEYWKDYDNDHDNYNGRNEKKLTCADIIVSNT